MSLTVTAHYSRNIIKYGGVFLVALVVGWSALTAGIAAWKAAHPPYIPPQTKYGRLPKIVFPDKSFEKKTFKFELANDKYPTYKDQAKVYVVYRPVSSFLALEQDTKTARVLGFMTTPTEIKSNIYEFKNDTLNQTLTMNVLDGSFKMEYPYLNDQMLMNPPKVPSKDEAINTAAAYLQNASKYSEDLKLGEKKVGYWKISYDGLKSAPSQSDANVARVDFFRKNLEDDFEIVTSEPGRASVSVLISGAQVDGKKVIEVNYKYINIDRQSLSTYPIKTSEQAVADLKMGAYWPAADTTTSNVTIRRMYLAYFEPISLTNYMQPVYVFEGDNNFIAYVAAVTDEWVTD